MENSTKEVVPQGLDLIDNKKIDKEKVEEQI